MTSADDEYKGYFILKGTAIFGSAWYVRSVIPVSLSYLCRFRAILHNPRDYPDPEVFIPERYVTMTPEGAYEPKPNAPDPRLAAFGFGRRICVGRHIADASLFASVATVLATVNVVRAKDREGNETVPEVVPSSGFLSHPKPFEYVLEYRDESSWGLLATALEHAEC
jgi:cytochrome P450